MNLGFIGFGAMGHPMAEHLLNAGHGLSVWSRRPESAAALVAQGARWCAAPAEVARHADIVCTNVTGSADVEGLAAELAKGFARGGIHLDFSTIAPSAARRIDASYAALGVDFVDAPVSGGSAGAKACNQMVMVAAIEAAAEAARLAAAAGIDFARVRTAMLGGSAGSRVLEVFGERMATREFAAGVEARLHHKDYALLMDEAARIGAALPVSATVWQQLNALMAQGRGRQDTSSLLRVLESGAGSAR